MALYSAFVPKQAAGADKNYFDIFNVAGSGLTIEVLSVQPVVSGAVIVTGTLGVDLILARTTAAGIGGTAATYEGTSSTAMTICAFDSSQPLRAGLVSGMLTATSGATIGSVISWDSVFTEETNAGAYTPAVDLIIKPNWGGLIVKPGSGFKVIQGAVASVGNIGFNVLFRI
jgi:hypothetical protein